MSARTSIGPLAVAMAAVAALAACGDDEDTEATAPAAAAAATAAPAATDAAPATTGAAGGDAAGFCDPYIEVTMAFSGPEPDPEAVAAALDETDANTPDEIAAEVSTMTAAARSVLDGGGQDFSAFEAPEFGRAQGVVDPYVFENCEIDEKAEVSASEYMFDGVADEFVAGQLAVLMTNDGDEAHELAVLRMNDGVTQSWDEILELPEEEALELVTEVGGTFAPTKGSAGLGVMQLEAGEHIALCFIPVGTSMGDDGEFVEGDGPPHFVEGMQHEFTVTG